MIKKTNIFRFELSLPHSPSPLPKISRNRKSCTFIVTHKCTCGNEPAPTKYTDFSSVLIIIMLHVVILIK